MRHASKRVFRHQAIRAQTRGSEGSRVVVSDQLESLYVWTRILRCEIL